VALAVTAGGLGTLAGAVVFSGCDQSCRSLLPCSCSERAPSDGLVFAPLGLTSRELLHATGLNRRAGGEYGNRRRLRGGKRLINVASASNQKTRVRASRTRSISSHAFCCHARLLVLFLPQGCRNVPVSMWRARQNVTGNSGQRDLRYAMGLGLCYFAGAFPFEVPIRRGLRCEGAGGERRRSAGRT